jgi:hypothetical protein
MVQSSSSNYQKLPVKFISLPAVASVKNTIFWNVTPRNFVEAHRRFGKCTTTIFSVEDQTLVGFMLRLVSLPLFHTCCLFPCWLDLFFHPETSVSFYPFTWCNSQNKFLINMEPVFTETRNWSTLVVSDLRFSCRWMMVSVFWDVTPYSPAEVHRHFGGPFCLHQTTNRASQKIAFYFNPSCSDLHHFFLYDPFFF